MAAIAELKSRGDIQNCWRCGKPLYADLAWPHPNCITLGHLIALEDGGSLLDPDNRAAECIACNMGDGARRTNAKRRNATHPKRYTSTRW